MGRTMTWPGWGDVLPVLAMVGGVVGSVLGAVWTLARMGDRLVSRAVKEGSGEAAKATEALYERLKANDFKHVEAKIDSGLNDVSERMGRVETTARADRQDMEARLGKRLDRVEATVRADRRDMEARLGRRLDRVEGRIMEAIREWRTPADQG